MDRDIKKKGNDFEVSPNVVENKEERFVPVNIDALYKLIPNDIIEIAKTFAKHNPDTDIQTAHALGILQGRQQPATPTAVDELDLEEAADKWVISLDSYMSDHPTKDHIAHPSFIAGYNLCAQTKQSKVVEVIEAYKREFKGYEISNDESFAEAIHNSAMLILTDLLTKLKQ